MGGGRIRHMQVVPLLQNPSAASRWPPSLLPWAGRMLQRHSEQRRCNRSLEIELSAWELLIRARLKAVLPLLVCLLVAASPRVPTTLEAPWDLSLYSVKKAALPLSSAWCRHNGPGGNPEVPPVFLLQVLVEFSADSGCTPTLSLYP